MAWGARKRERQRYQRWAWDVAERWGEVAMGIGLGRRSLSAGGLPCSAVPVVEGVRQGPPVWLAVRMLPGQVLADYTAVAGRIAAGMGVLTARIHGNGPGRIGITLLASDALTTEALSVPMGLSGTHRVGVGVDEDARGVVVDFRERVHLLVQGRTGSGKSRLTYTIVEQLARNPDALIGGCDPSSVLLRPFEVSRHAAWQNLGADAGAHAGLLDRLVGEMDTRLARIPQRCDVLPVSPEFPMIYVVLEEWLSVLNLAGSDRRLRERLAVGARRLATESGKVGMRLIMLVQRAEAAEMGGGLLRSQFAHRLSLPVDNVESIRLLHPTAPISLAEAHLRCGRAGFALYEGPGREVARIRTPWVEDYGSYWDAVKDTLGEGDGKRKGAIEDVTSP